jgi:hypothetical protein
MEKTPTTIKNEARGLAFKTMVEIFRQHYGEDLVFIIGDSEIAVQVDTSPDGEPIYATFSPTVKDYCDRKTKTKTIKAYNVNEAAAQYVNKVNEREIKAEENKAKKEAKIKRDKELREQRKAEREKA